LCFFVIDLKSQQMNSISALLKPIFLLAILISSAPFFAQVKKENKLLIGRIALSENEYRSAIEKFNYVIKNEPPNYEPYYFRGIAKLELGDVVGAEGDFTEAIKLRPLYVDSYIARASVRDRLLNHKGAFEDFDSAIKISPTNSNIYLNRAITYNSLQDYKKAIKDCEKALYYRNKKELVYIIRGMSELGLKNYYKAINDFDAIIKSNPRKATTYVRRATAQYYLFHYDSALTDINHALHLDDKNSYAYFQRAMVYNKIEHKDDALKDLNMVLELSPNSTSAYYNRALIFADKENYKKALADYEKVILLNPRNILAYYNRAIIYNKLKKVKLARKDVEKIIEIYPDFIDAYRLRASLKKQIGDYKGAEQDQQTAEIINSTKLDITDSLKKHEEMNIAKVTSFSGNNNNQNVNQISSSEIALISPYYISLLASANHRRIVDSWNKKNKSFSAYFLLNDNDEINDELKTKKLEKLNEKILLDFRNGELYLKRAVINASLGIYDRALLDFNKSLHLDADNYMVYFGKANMLYQIIQKDESSAYTLAMVIKDYDKCIELNPNFSYAYFNRAYLKFQNENYIGAIEDYSEAINQSPSFAEAYLNRALILLILENNEQACKDLSKAGELGITKGYSLISKYCNK